MAAAGRASSAWPLRPQYGIDQHVPRLTAAEGRLAQPALEGHAELLHHPGARCVLGHAVRLHAHDVVVCEDVNDERPRRFVSDEAFRFQLVRMWRSQTSLSVGSTYDAKRDRTTGWYRDLPPRVVLYLAEILTTAYVPVVSYMTTLIKKDEEQRRLLLPE